MPQDEQTTDSRDATADQGVQRLDKWLWFARVLKSRTQAATAVAEGRVRVNRVRTTKPAHAVKPGDVLTVALREKVLVLKVLRPGARRGPSIEACSLYQDLTPPPAPPQPDAGPAHASRDAGAGRPSKRERRLIDRLKGRD